MAKYSRGASKKVEEAMHEMKEGDLRTGTGKKVTSRKQAVAIGLSEARDEGKKVPKKDKDNKKKKRYKFARIVKYRMNGFDSFSKLNCV
jgi:hypothetical protein